MRHISLFSGIGGIDLAAHAAGFETVCFCEFDGSTMRQAGDIIGVTREMVRLYLRSLGVATRPRKLIPPHERKLRPTHWGSRIQDRPEIAEAMAELVREGDTLAEIAARFGCSPMTVSRNVRKAGVCLGRGAPGRARRKTRR